VVVLLDPIVLLAAGPVERFVAQRLANRSGRGVVSVGRHLLGRVTDDVQGLGEEPLRGVHVASLAAQRVDAIASTIDRPLQIAPVPADADVGLVRVPLGCDGG